MEPFIHSFVVVVPCCFCFRLGIFFYVLVKKMSACYVRFLFCLQPAVVLF